MNFIFVYSLDCCNFLFIFFRLKLVHKNVLQAQRSNNTNIPKLNPISPVDKDNILFPEDTRESSPTIKQEPIHDSNPLVDSFHSMSEALQTVSNKLYLINILCLTHELRNCLFGGF